MPSGSSLKEYYYKFNNIDKFLASNYKRIKYVDFLTMYDRKDFSEMEWYNRDINEILNIVQERITNKKTFSGYINCLVIIYSSDRVKYDLLKESYLTIKKELDVKRNENEVETTNLVDLSNDAILNGLSNLKDWRSKVIFALYTTIPARRLEYRYLKYVKMEPEDGKDNYLIFNNDFTFTLIFNEYKTKNKYHRQEFKIDNDICCKTIASYLINSKLDYDTLVFKNNIGQTYTASSFSTVVANILTLGYRNYTTLNDVRHSWANKVNGLLPTLNVNEIDEITKMSGHSIMESLKYRKLVK